MTSPPRAFPNTVPDRAEPRATPHAMRGWWTWLAAIARTDVGRAPRRTEPPIASARIQVGPAGSP
jgi:hypothetical protein